MTTSLFVRWKMLLGRKLSGQCILQPIRTNCLRPAGFSFLHLSYSFTWWLVVAVLCFQKRDPFHETVVHCWPDLRKDLKRLLDCDSRKMHQRILERLSQCEVYAKPSQAARWQRQGGLVRCLPVSRLALSSLLKFIKWDMEKDGQRYEQVSIRTFPSGSYKGRPDNWWFWYGR